MNLGPIKRLAKNKKLGSLLRGVSTIIIGQDYFGIASTQRAFYLLIHYDDERMDQEAKAELLE